MVKETSPHILNTSANLLGFCLFVITSLHIASKIETQRMDGFTSIIATLLTISCILSFIGMRSKIKTREKLLEQLAEYFFLVSLIGILVIILLITSNYFE